VLAYWVPPQEKLLRHFDTSKGNRTHGCNHCPPRVGENQVFPQLDEKHDGILRCDRILDKMPNGASVKPRLARALAWTAVALLSTALAAQEPKPLPGSEDCLNCHDSGRSTGRREAGMPPAFDAAALRGSPHAELECKACHADLAEYGEVFL
jgi:hypothetical protein